MSQKDFFDNVENKEEKANFFEARLNVGIAYNISENVRLLLRNGGLAFVSGSWENVGSQEKKDFSSFSTKLNLSNVFFGVELRL